MSSVLLFVIFEYYCACGYGDLFLGILIVSYVYVKWWISRLAPRNRKRGNCKYSIVGKNVYFVTICLSSGLLFQLLEDVLVVKIFARLIRSCHLCPPLLHVLIIKCCSILSEF